MYSRPGPERRSLDSIGSPNERIDWLALRATGTRSRGFIHTLRAGCRVPRVACAVLPSRPFNLPKYLSMEVSPLRRSIDDLSERCEALRRFL
jgi:hypothetical protein